LLFQYENNTSVIAVLGNNPRRQFHEWKVQVSTLASSLFVNRETKGLQAYGIGIQLQPCLELHHSNPDLNHVLQEKRELRYEEETEVAEQEKVVLKAK
jgi:hypothetical protein